MLSHLHIKNYALIRELELSPAPGLSVITGETGAGKSIMLGALGMLMGRRADTKILLSKEQKCVIEAEFSIANYNLEVLFEEADIDYEPHTIIRREINPNGKSRAFINDLPTTLDVLKRVGLKLLDIHSQNESLTIANREAKLSMVDNYAQTADLLAAYKSCYRNFKKSEQQLNDLQERQASLSKEEDYNNFLLEELLAAELKTEEQEQLESELRVLDNSEDIKLKLSQVVGEFQESDFSLSDKLSELSLLLQSTSAFSALLGQLSERFASSLTELRDVVSEVQHVLENVAYDPQRLEEVNQRLGMLYQLQQKHRVSSISDLLAIQEDLAGKVQSSQNLEEAVKKAQKELAQDQKRLNKAAVTLSKRRTQVLDKFSSDINQMLGYVGMPDGKLQMTHQTTALGRSGVDEVEVLFSANRGIPLQPVGQAASGGEFSRLMLCIKYLLAAKTAMPTIIFDEIDSGVSGEIAKKMALMIKRMSERHQVITISHLPQIAAKGDTHYFVYKNNFAGSTESIVRKLNAEDHVQEIAKMIGGENPSQITVQNARELIEG